MTRWSVGDLAKASGLTVRTLHHYDEIGLVGASERTASGHRRYTPDDVRRLYQVRSLRQRRHMADGTPADDPRVVDYIGQARTAL